MIPRYTRPEMASIWDAQTRFQIWFEIEARQLSGNFPSRFWVMVFGPHALSLV